MNNQDEKALLAYRRVRGLVLTAIEDEIDLLGLVLKLPTEPDVTQLNSKRREELKELLEIIKGDGYEFARSYKKARS